MDGTLRRILSYEISLWRREGLGGPHAHPWNGWYGP